MPQPTTHLAITVYGNPATQGSKKAIPIYRGKGADRQLARIAVMEQGDKKLRPWRSDVRDAAVAVLPNDWQPWDCALTVTAAFALPKPARAPKTRRVFPDKRPDLDKLVRAIFDALGTAGVWTDDSRVVHLRTFKLYAGDPNALHRPGVHLRIAPLTTTEVQ